MKDEGNIVNKLKPLSVKEQQLKFAEFAQNIHNRNKGIL